MQFLTLSRRRAGLCCEIDLHRRLEAEAGFFEIDTVVPLRPYDSSAGCP